MLTLCCSIMSRATLILYYQTSMLTLQCLLSITCTLVATCLVLGRSVAHWNTWDNSTVLYFCMQREDTIEHTRPFSTSSMKTTCPILLSRNSLGWRTDDENWQVDIASLLGQTSMETHFSIWKVVGHDSPTIPIWSPTFGSNLVNLNHWNINIQRERTQKRGMHLKEIELCGQNVLKSF